MSAVRIVARLKKHGLRVFRTGDVATLCRLSAGAATHALDRLATEAVVLRLKRSVWGNLLAEGLSPQEAVPHLAAPWPTYVSLYSALSAHGLIEEVPQIVYAVTSGKPRQYSTSLAEFRFHHLPMHLIWGFGEETTSRARYPLADPEKAFLDTAYLALVPRSGLGYPPRRGRRWDLDEKKLREYAVRFRSERLWSWLKEHRLVRGDFPLVVQPKTPPR